MKKILFVCLGNICRSPMAEAIFNNKVRKLGIESKYISDSAGTASYHIGEDPDSRTVEIVKKNGMKINHLGKQFLKKHGEDFDYIIAMDASNRKNILNEIMGSNKHKVYLMRDFDPLEKGDVPDPYYGEEGEFDNVFKILNRSIDAFINHIRSEKD
ncbi:MAG: low molecular weight phosphotyrosine protein phosphatase [Ekhidna sp.]|nr:low molecular weight phosphotyrosine protein phosphatase [Ekhidna sp.]